MTTGDDGQPKETGQGLVDRRASSYTHLMDDDTAGPLLGWSIGNGVSKAGSRPIEDLVSYPCVFRFKAIARAEGDLAKELIVRIEAVVGTAIEESAWTVRDSSGGRYTCLTVDVYVTSGQQVYDIYEALKQDARVTHLL